MTPQLALKALAPLAFFGYAAFANLQLFTSDVEGPELAGFLSGEVTAEIDTLYRANLPHRDPSVGLIGALRYALLREGRDGVVVGQRGWLFTDEEFRPLKPTRLDDTVAWIASAQAELDAMGSTLIVVPLPAKLDIAGEHGPGATQSARVAGDYAAFLGALDNAGIPHLDTRPVLAGAQARFFRTDTHWTPDGAAEVAFALAQAGTIPPGETAFERIDKDPVRFQGDLVTFVTSDTLAPLVGLAPEQATPYLALAAVAPEADAALDIFGTSGPVPLALVGTSYSANPNFSFVEALKLALAHDVLNYAEEGFGPVAPMRAFLADIDRAAPPPAVIWEFPVRYLSDPKLMDDPKTNSEADNA
ncbi:MAG: hypothetical protein AAF626_11745 [Pseudomonadota bacterium]